jgi:hypothetical protein
MALTYSGLGPFIDPLLPEGSGNTSYDILI